MAVVIALLSGVFVIAGVIAGGVFQIEASRRGLLRTEQLDAATRMHIAGVAFFTAMERRARTLGRDDVAKLTATEKLAWLTAEREHTDAAREDARRLMERLARVILVFGEQSAPGQTATQAVGHGHRLIAILADEGTPRADEFAAEWDAAVDSLSEFSAAAHDVFTKPLWVRN